MKLRAEPAHEAAGFFGGAGRVEGDQALQDLLVGQRGRPAVGGEDRGGEVVVDLFEDADEAGFVDLAFLVGQGQLVVARPGRAAGVAAWVNHGP